MRPTCAVFLLLASALAAASSLAHATVVRPVLPDAAKSHFGISRGDLIRPSLSSSQISFTNAAGVPFTLALTPLTLRSPDFILILKTGAAETTLRGDALPASHLFAASVTVDGVEEHDATAIVSLAEDGSIRARIDRMGQTTIIEPASKQTGNQGDHVLFDAADALPATDKKTIEVFPPHGAAQREFVERYGTVQSLEVTERISGCGVDNYCLTDIAVEVDYEYYSRWLSGTSAQVEYVIAGMNKQYERDVGIRHRITVIIINTSPTQPYTATDPNTLLVQFRDYWNANRGSISRDVAHLFTGKELDGSTIGIAYIGVVCVGTYAYGLTQSDFNNNDASRFDLIAHEVGHNWNAQHCTCTSYTMNAYLTSACIFNSQSITEITTYRDSHLSCLTPIAMVGGCTLDSECDDGIFCNGVEKCVSGRCANATNPCAANGTTCVESSKTCSACNFNGVCDLGESCTTCPSDCIKGGGAVCGNGKCETNAGESCRTCPQDCPGLLSGQKGKQYCCGSTTACSDTRCSSKCATAPPAFCCGDGVCTSSGENSTNCLRDCPL